MKCNKCASKRTRVTCTEHKDRHTIRYCRCLDCKKRFKTIERYSRKRKTGGRYYNAKLTPEIVQRLRKNRENYSNEEWSAIYNVEISTIYNARSHITWKHVPE